MTKGEEVIKMTELGRIIHEEGREEGIQEGIEKRKEDVAKELLKGGLLTKEQIARVTKLSVTKVEALEKSLGIIL